jgi:hypothetical protein
MKIMNNCLEYSDLLDHWSHNELQRAWEAIHCCELQEEFYEEEGPLLAFLLDNRLQEKLHLYFKDIEYNENERPTHDL